MFKSRIIAVLVLLGLVAGCAAPQSRGTYQINTQAQYFLDTGDVVRVTVYGDAELSNLYQVDDRGMIAFPLVGPVQARGSTTQATASRIAAALANGYMRSPDVAVEIAEYRPFFIQGAVSSSGQYPYVFGMTVRAAISTAGGYTDTANRNQATIYRRQGSEMVKGEVDLDFPVRPGDTIVIPDRWL